MAMVKGRVGKGRETARGKGKGKGKGKERKEKEKTSIHEWADLSEKAIVK